MVVNKIQMKRSKTKNNNGRQGETIKKKRIKNKNCEIQYMVLI